MTLAYDDRGVGPAVVLIHGHPFDRSLWRPQLDSLSGAWRVVAPDLRGFGETPVTAGTVGMREFADDVWELLAGLGIEAAAVVGLSMGGLIAMEMSIAHPRRVWALGLVATTAQPVAEGERERRLALADRVEAEGMGVMLDYMSPQFGRDPDPRVVRRRSVPRLSDRTAGGAQHVPRDGVPDPVRRAAARRAQLDAWTHEITPHDAAREHQEVHGGLPVRRPSDGHPALDASGCLSTIYPDAKRIWQRRQPPAADSAPDREGADDCRLGLPPQHRPARTSIRTTT